MITAPWGVERARGTAVPRRTLERAQERAFHPLTTRTAKIRDCIYETEPLAAALLMISNKRGSHLRSYPLEETKFQTRLRLIRQAFYKRSAGTSCPSLHHKSKIALSSIESPADGALRNVGKAMTKPELADGNQIPKVT